MTVTPLAAADLPALVALQRLAYRVEAELLGVPTLPPLGETEEEIAASGEHLLGVREAGELLGAVGYKRAGAVVDVHRLAVRPDAFRRGIASALLDAVEAREPDATHWLVATGAANGPARALYERRGFTVHAERVAGSGVAVVEYRRSH